MSSQRRGTRRRRSPSRSVAQPSLDIAPADRRLGLAMLPLRLFLGATFVYAGLDKLWFDPTFLDSSAPTSLAAQLAGFAHTSPLAPLIVALGEPLAVPLGVLIALAEIAIGLGALAGLLARLCAWGGVALAALLFLTASWAVHPYYLGPDLPYLAGWLTLALVGDGGIGSLAGSIRRWGIAQGWLDGPGRATAPRAWADEAETADLERRRFLEGAVLAALAVALGGAAALLGWRSRGAGAAAGVARTASTTARATASVGPAQGTGSAVGDLATVTRLGSQPFQDPATGDPSVLVHLSDGRVLAFDAVCTHAGCTVEFDSSQDVFLCPCHGAVFDARARGAVLRGPAAVPLGELPINVNATTGVIRLSS